MINATISKVTVLLILTFCYCTKALSNNCPVIVAPDPLTDQDTACVQALEKNVKEFSFPNIPLKGLRNELLREYILANQQYVIDTFYVNYCQTLANEQLNLSVNEQSIELNIAKDILYATVPFSPPIIDSRNISGLPARFDDVFAWHDSNHYLNTSFETQLSEGEQEKKQILKASIRTGWLREPPFVINKANKYFVIVGSVKSYESAKQEVIRLKKRAPAYDFVAYAPYESNPYYAIMVATWVPYSIANKVVAKAKVDIEKSSYIWQCPREGDQC